MSSKIKVTGVEDVVVDVGRVLVRIHVFGFKALLLDFLSDVQFGLQTVIGHHTDIVPLVEIPETDATLEPDIFANYYKLLY
jgi:hypothetical protein